MIRNEMMTAALALLVTAGTAHAQFFGTPTVVNGGVDAHVWEGTSVLSVMGSGSSATSLASSVTENSTVNGSFTANTSTSIDAAIVLGVGATARNIQASVNGAHVNGNVSLNAYTHDVVTVAVGAGAVACTNVASINRPTLRSYHSVVSTRGIYNIGIGTVWPGIVNIGSLGSPC
jgi:hypothetical protein